jgi:hypothetical protein
MIFSKSNWRYFTFMSMVMLTAWLSKTDIFTWKTFIGMFILGMIITYGCENGWND